MMIWTDKHLKWIFILILFSIFGFQSCGTRTMVRQYYILDLPGEEVEAQQDSISGEGICEILRTRIPPAYDQLRIAVRKRSHEISYYQHHYWAMNPAENLTTLLEQKIQHSHIFAYSSSGVLKGVPDYQIVVEVLRLEVIDQDDIYSVGAEMRMDLLDYEKGSEILSHRFDRIKPLESRDLNLFASELSLIFDEEINHFISKIRNFFRQNRSDSL